ncbi:hypothetical protein [uncultured Prevotella sp.]|uniref:hypothetical protein n=1 Tax=uncultured Prevotella sp. TaxID=159272 RepID=UPI0025E6E02A|nr:hypothetical protein [uncultured Prevotella sp.]
MKKFTLVALAMMASASCFAQTTLWNGEDTKITSGEHAGFWGDASPVLADNHETDGINTSAHCLKFVITKGGNNNTVKLPFKDWIKPSMNGSKRVSLMIKKENAENVIVQLSDPTDGSTGYWYNQATWYDGGNKWQKLVFDFTANGDFDKPGVMSITPQAGNIDGDQIVYIDNIVIENAPRINGKLFSEYNAENPISGALTLTGAWMKGSSINVDDKWKNNTYNDFEFFKTQATDGVTSIDMRGTVTKDVDINQFFKNPNTIVYADAAYEHANVVVNGTAASVELTDANAFNAPEDFTATTVKLTRGVQKGINSFVLPFAATAEELGATQVATYDSYDKAAKIANFKTAADVAANTPFLTMDVAEDKKADVLNFGEKTIVATPESLGTDFVGVYAKTNANGKYGINADGKLQKGGEGAYVNAFHAYLNVTDPAAVAFNGSTPTAINGVAADKVADTAVYDLSGRRVYGKLQKGLYIMNGKKVVVK